MLPVDKLINDLKNRKENLSPGFLEDFERHFNIFVQPIPRYATKQLYGKPWKTHWGTTPDPVILAALYGKYYFGSLARWYPEYFIIDVDNQPLKFVLNERESLGLDEYDSILIASESPDSYYMLGKQLLNGRPPSLKRYQHIIKPYAKEHHIEGYPQKGRVIRNPFNPHLKFLDNRYFHLKDWQEKLHAFDNLYEFEISCIPGQHIIRETQIKIPFKFADNLHEGFELLEHGLTRKHTRHNMQAILLWYLMRKGIPPDQAVLITWKWINEKHNGFSDTIKSDPVEVLNEIKRQARSIEKKFSRLNILPDYNHNNHNGWLTESDILKIIKRTHGSRPLTKFLFHLLKYYYPRRHRDAVRIHHDKLIEWSSCRTYIKFIAILESIGVLERGSAYLQDDFSKSIKLHWRFSDFDKAILEDGRALETLEDTLRLIYQPVDYRQLLTGSGVKRTTSIEAVKSIFSGVSKKATHH